MTYSLSIHRTVVSYGNTVIWISIRVLEVIIDSALWTLDGKYIVTAYTGSAWASLLLTGPPITLLVMGGELLHVSQVHEPLSGTPVQIVFIPVMMVVAVASIILVIRMNIK